MNPTPDGTLADPQQVIAELRRQLDERTAERDEALARETATAEVLRVINSSPGDLAPVFDAMLERAMRLCEAAFGTITVKGYTVAARGVPDIYAEWRTNNPIPRSQAHIAEDEPFMHVVDVKDDNRYRSGDPHRRALVDLGGARTYLVIPLRHGFQKSAGRQMTSV